MREVRIQDLIGDFRVLPPLDFAAAPGFRQLIGPNPHRWCFVLITSGGNPPILTTDPSGGSALATISQQNMPFPFNFRDYGALVTVGWMFQMVTAGSLLHVEQVEYWPDGRPANFEQMLGLAARLGGRSA
jgi:hypothetical protein